MGYCYENGRLVCEVCSVADGTVHKVRCKYGYCPADALCKNCRADVRVRALREVYCEDHCRPASAEFAAREARKEALLDAGEFVRTSASLTESGLTAVTFTNRAGRSMVYLMDADTYRAVPLMGAATVMDFGRFGRVMFRAVVEA